MRKQPLKVIAGAPDRPLAIGDIEIQCYVLEDETRVLSQGGFLTALGRHGRPQAKAKEQVEELPRFLESANLKSFVSSELIKSSKPIPFRALSGGSVGHGYSALLLPQVCDVYLKAREAKALRASQLHIAKRAEVLMRGLATVGVIALVDEVTGYQQLRAERALATILERFIADVSGHEEVSKSRRLSALRPVVPSRPGLEEPTRIVAVGAVRNRVCAVLQAAVGALFASTGASASTARALARDGAFG